jgi:Flp pilus assembly secretin CpaC
MTNKRDNELIVVVTPKILERTRATNVQPTPKKQIAYQ